MNRSMQGAIAPLKSLKMICEKFGEKEKNQKTNKQTNKQTRNKQTNKTKKQKIAELKLPQILHPSP